METKLSHFTLSFAVFFLLFTTLQATPLKTGFYKRSCPSAESIIRSTVEEFTKEEAGIPAAVLRLHFHDCFVRGCDGSVLIKSTPGNSAEVESQRNLGIAGFNAIDAAKSKLESLCPNTVSCADILAYAARDSVHISKGLWFEVPAGRRDGTVSLASEADQNLPLATFDVPQLEQNFKDQGLSFEHMVILSGAHSIGEAHCASFSHRLFSFNKTFDVDPSMLGSDAKALLAICGRNATNRTASLNPTSHTVLDNDYFKQLKKRKGVLFSDQVLWDTASSRPLVQQFIDHPDVWAAKFKRAMVRMGKIGTLTGLHGQIRKNCSVVNSYH